MSDDSYRALVRLKRKDEGRVFLTRYIKSAYNHAIKRRSSMHTFASSAVMRGVGLKELKSCSGPQSPGILPALQ